MSWNDYVSNQLVATGTVSRGAIVGLDGQIWAISPDWAIEPAECTVLASGFKDTSALTASGMKCAGEKYFYLSGTPETLRGKKGNKGIHVAKTKTAFIIGQYEDPVQPAQCATTVEALADYLKEQNF